MGNENKSCSTGTCETGKCGKMMMPMMIIVILLVIVGIFVYTNNTKGDSENVSSMNNTEKLVNSENNDNMMEDKQEWTEEEMKKMEEEEMKKDNMEEKTDMMESAYNTYSPELLSADKTNVLFFAATWCPSCQTADKNFSSETIPDNINLLKVDYDTYTDLKQKYGITMQHTFVEVDANGNEIKKWSGSFNVADLVKEI